ncbi:MULTISPECIES: alpha/beta hydrolase fold domain-containing protein [Sphingobium]|uniref:alpha/beta hydrolase fold domain-containing protein n=1 Tax=Sphingobium sp. MI1205 TaxID=407020 RepID=UPI0007702DE3|nr:alpha/beta hydrolase fold domain-containing protein [Sphingobium sp. MI1205]AMK19988.1 Lipolytic enzyme [Sphingobium sp. MI1205]
MISSSIEDTMDVLTRWGLPPLQPGKPADAELLATREQVIGLEAIQIGDPAVSLSQRQIGAIRCLVATPAAVSGTMIYFHGGGYRVGRPELSAGWASRIAARTGLEVVLPAYALAPEHPYPAALASAAEVYDSLLGQPRLIVAGESAGGGLAAALALAAATSGKRRPDALILLSPWLDLSASGESFVSAAATDTMFSRQAALDAAEGYRADATIPSVLDADAGLFPPAWLCASAHEVLRDDAVAFAGLLARAGGRVELTVAPDLPHVWPIFQPDSSETARTLASIAAFADTIG